jgi:hypothetical protein
MATEVSVASALPSEMNFQLPPSLPMGSKNFEIRVQPVNQQSFVKGNVIQVDIPCGRVGQYLDPTTSYIRYKATYTHAGTNGTDFSYLLGSAYSPFIRQEVYGNNSVLLESINEVGVLTSMLLNISLNDADKKGLSPSLGFDGDNITAYGASANTGHQINKDTSINNLIFEYATPLVGILGTGTDKMFPIGNIFGLRFELTVDDYAFFTKAATANTISGFTISEFEFVANVIELAPEAQALISQANPEKIYIRSQTYRQSSAVLPSSAGVGAYDLLCGIRVSSLKSLFIQTYNSNMVDGKYGSILGNYDQGTCLLINGQAYPQRTLNPAGHPADAFIELQKSLGALSLSVFNGAVSKRGYYKSSTAYSLCLAYTSAVGSIVTSPNQAFLGIDTEVVARKNNLLSGISCNNSPMFFRAQIGATLAAYAHVVNFFGFYDVILEVDVNAKNIIAKF